MQATRDAHNPNVPPAAAAYDACPQIPISTVGQIFIPVAVAVEAIAAVSDAIGWDDVPLHSEECVPGVGIVQVEVQRGQASVWSDPQGKCVGELNVAVVEGAGEQFKVIRKPQVVVLHVGHVRAARLSEGAVPVRVAEVRSFGQIEPADARVLHTGDNILRVVSAAIAHDEQLKVFQRLRQNRTDCYFEYISAVVGWQQDAELGRASQASRLT
jgi:hypothetical protein